MKVLLVNTVAVFSIATFSHSNAQVNTLDTEENKGTDRVRYAQSPELPDSIAFEDTLAMLEFINGRDPEDGKYWIESSMGIDSASAEILRDKMIETRERFNADMKAYVKESACNEGAAVVFGDQVYEVFERIDDENETLAASHFASFKADIGIEMTAKLQSWLNDRKINITYVKPDHKANYELTGKDGDAAIAEICVYLNK